VFTSRLCGVSLAAHENWGSDVQGVTKGMCVAVFEPPAYAAKVGKSSPSVMMMSLPAQAGDSANAVAKKFLKGKYESAVPVKSLTCPTAACVAYEIFNKDMYADQGGAHLMLVVFERDMPEFDGLVFERAEAPPKPTEQGKMTYFRPGEGYHRLPGKMYYLVLLDSNVAIFDAAKKDYDFFLKSIRVE
jgi:hypothetical protein